jgi:hypothetical protein
MRLQCGHLTYAVRLADLAAPPGNLFAYLIRDDDLSWTVAALSRLGRAMKRSFL